MKTKFACVVLTCVVLSVSGCGSRPQNLINGNPEKLIVGKWEAAGSSGIITAEFSKDGKANLTMFGQTLQGTYKMNGDDELEWTLNGKTTKCKVKVTATELEVTSEGKTVNYKKV
jgi:uncharacterized protein (TIGR03066 family)